MKAFYRVDDDQRESADKTLLGACRKMTRQQWYNRKHTAVAHFMAEKGEKVTKHDLVRKMPNVTKEDLMLVSKLSMRFYVPAKLQLHYLFLK